jgi:hypothetical protein
VGAGATEGRRWQMTRDHRTLSHCRPAAGPPLIGWPRAWPPVNASADAAVGHLCARRGPLTCFRPSGCRSREVPAPRNRALGVSC